MFQLESIQGALGQLGLDGWLLYDFYGSNPLARRILDFPSDRFTSRRFYYLIPATGEPRKLCHRIEEDALDHLPGEKEVYLRWQELEGGLEKILEGMTRVAMEYSPRNGIPYVSIVDAGTVELVRSTGVEVVSSGDLIQSFEATLDDEQWETHLEAERHTLAAFSQAWEFIADRVRSGKTSRETEVQNLINQYFDTNGLLTDHPAIVAVGPHSGNPHYGPGPLTDSVIREGDFVLIDAWCKVDRPRSVFADYTRVGFVGQDVPKTHADIFAIVAGARDAAVDLVKSSIGADRPLQGWQVDDAARHFIEEAGYGQYFLHRTGHNIAEDLHGNGTHMDNLETHDDRSILRRTCFSIEPGIYMKDFGIRSEVNVYIDGNGAVHVTGEPQTEILPVLV